MVPTRRRPSAQDIKCPTCPTLHSGQILATSLRDLSENPTREIITDEAVLSVIMAEDELSFSVPFQVLRSSLFVKDQFSGVDNVFCSNSRHIGNRKTVNPDFAEVLPPAGFIHRCQVVNIFS
ncbi:hypothetical protein AVEN_275778-1 [Araneus ventricosus]|uniref:Uncharacterized protein n=1 Tax=Araneus ventricosus TaxID=182803 RepID=A0A4Y2HEN1_ARAVE|nr:hypothetical protein AVEN_275778-1 [Araneus ventricosus]